jgi:beta-aspartyl-dipeptidase (metallo-type)
MPLLIRNAQVFAPRALGQCEVLLAGSRIAEVRSGKIDIGGSSLEIVDAGGRWLLPGFVDALTHPCGGGGEGGFANRTAEIPFEEFVQAGITTPVGALGTDSIARSLEVLYGKVMELRASGLAALMYNGSYRVPPATLTGDVARDLVLVEPVIGLGEVAVADHRSSQPSVAEMCRLAADVHLGGTLSGKRGVVFLHMGDGQDGLGLIEHVLQSSDLPRRLFYPTHINRRRGLFEQAIEHVKAGGFADITVSTTPELIAAGEMPALEALREAIEAGAPAERLSLSSDAGGSLPLYRDGELMGLKSATPSVLLAALVGAMGSGERLLEPVIAALTRNPATALGLAGKGRVEAGADADLLLIEPDSGRLTDVFCLGRRLMNNGSIQ